MIIKLLATWIPALLIAFLGVLKLTGNPRVPTSACLSLLRGPEPVRHNGPP